MYVCMYKLETAHEQATITALIQNISLGRHGLEQRKVLKRESFHNIQFFYKIIFVTAGKAVSREAVVAMLVTEFSNPLQFSYQ